MQVLSVAGSSNAGKTTLVGRLAARHRRAGAAETYGVRTDGTWFATGTGRDFDGLVDDLAGRSDYLLVEGYAAARLPTVALGGCGHAGKTVASAPDADAVDLDDLVEAIEALEPVETLASLVDRVTSSPDAEYAGAVATFTGRVRARDDPEDLPAEHLTVEKYDGVAEQRLADIRADLAVREGVYEVCLHHRTGLVPAGEDVVYVVVLAGHRPKAVAAVSDGIDRLKEEVPLFKKEVTVDEEFWAHGRE